MFAIDGTPRTSHIKVTAESLNYTTTLRIVGNAVLKQNCGQEETESTN
jgi:hypothetical protein